MNGPGSEVLQHDGDTPAAILELGVRPHDIQPIREVYLVIRVGRLCHDVQLVPHHHCTLSTAMGDDGLEAWYRTFVSKTFSSRSRGSSAVLVGNLSLSARLAHRN